MPTLDKARSKYYLLPSALIAMWGGTALLGTIERPSTASLVILVSLSVPLALWAFREQPPLHDRKALLAATALPIVVLFFASILGEDPRRSLLGGEPLHQGWLMWVSLWVWFALVLIGSRRGDLPRIAATLSVLGAFTGAWAFLEWAGHIGSKDSGLGTPLAFFDNSNSLAQALLISMFATMSLLHSRRIKRQAYRVGLLASLGIQAAALLGTRSHAAWIGLLIGVLMFVFVHEVALDRRSLRHDVSLALLFMIMGAIFSMFVAASGVLGPAGVQLSDQLLSRRPELWMSAAERVASSPLLGISPSTFESLTSWSPLANGDLSYVLTYDPHGMGAYWLLSAGFIGLVTMGIGAVMIALRLAYASRLATNSASIHWLCAGCAAVGIAMVTSWPEPVALATLSILVGSIISSTVNPESEPAVIRKNLAFIFVPVMVVTTCTLVSLVALFPSLGAEYSAMNGKWKTVVAEVQDLERAAKQSQDPYYTEAILSAILQYGQQGYSDEQAIGLIRKLDSSYSEGYKQQVDLPLLACEILWRRRDALPTDEVFDLTQRFVARGRAADPSLEVWDFAMARAAVTARRPDVQRYIDLALRAQISASGGEKSVGTALEGVVSSTRTANPTTPRGP